VEAGRRDRVGRSRGSTPRARRGGGGHDRDVHAGALRRPPLEARAARPEGRGAGALTPAGDDRSSARRARKRSRGPHTSRRRRAPPRSRVPTRCEVRGLTRIFSVALGILAAIGGFVDMGDLVFNAAAGAMFGYQLLWVVVV